MKRWAVVIVLIDGVRLVNFLYTMTYLWVHLPMYI